MKMFYTFNILPQLNMFNIRLQSISNLQCVRVGILVLGGRVFGWVQYKILMGHNLSHYW